VTPSEVKYKLHNDLNGPDYVIQKTEVFKIKYSDGTEDGPFTATTATEQPVTPTPITDTKRPPVGSSNSGGGVQQGNYTPVAPSATPAPYRRRGYAGMAIGGAFISEDYTNLKRGVQLAFNFGYLFGQNIGITSSFLFNSCELTNTDDSSVGIVGIVAGPLFSFSTASQKVDFDVRPQIGYVSLHATDDGKSIDTDDGAFAVDLGGSVRWNVSKLIALSANLDYLYHKKFEKSNIDLSAFAITFGVNFRF
jgi:hypothetical protein